MNDLISRSQLLKEIETWGGCVEALHEYIQNMPTAYDIGKVVEQLEEQKSGLTEWAEDEAFKLAIHKSIEIVKHGGVAESEQKLKEMESGNNGTME